MHHYFNDGDVQEQVCELAGFDEQVAVWRFSPVVERQWSIWMRQQPGAKPIHRCSSMEEVLTEQAYNPRKNLAHS